MSTLDPEIVIKTAHLAQLEPGPEEVAALSRDLADIFALFGALDRQEISALTPLGHPLGDTQPLREDKAVARDLMANIEENAPLAEDGFITVPKVIE